MGFFSSILSALTGGVSDVFSGNAPFSSIIGEGEKIGLYDTSHADWLKGLSADMFSGGFAQLPKGYEASKAVIAAPADQETAINQALTHLNLNWNIVVVDNITLAEGVY